MSEIGIKDQCFGVEVEMTGITRQQAAQALAEYFGTNARHTRGSYDTWTVRDTDGKDWKLMSDGSIKGEYKTASGYRITSDREYRVEMVTPKLTYAELPKFQECVQFLRPSRPCGRLQPQPPEFEEPHRHHVLQGGHPVQSLAGERVQGRALVQKSAGAHAAGGTDAILG